MVVVVRSLWCRVMWLLLMLLWRCYGLLVLIRVSSRVLLLLLRRRRLGVRQSQRHWVREVCHSQQPHPGVPRQRYPWMMREHHCLLP